MTPDLTPFCCPVCDGHGIVPNGFYSYPAGQHFATTSTAPEQCRGCLGTGIVWNAPTVVQRAFIHEGAGT